MGAVANVGLLRWPRDAIEGQRTALACAAAAGGRVHLLSGSELIQDQGHEHLVYEPDVYRFAADSVQAGVNSGAGQVAGRVYLLKSNLNVDEYDPAGDAWAQKTGSALAKRTDVLQTYRSGLGLHWAGGADGNSVSAVTESYDAATDAWTVGTSMPGAKRLFGATTIGDDAFAAGGLGGSVPSPTMDAAAFEYSAGAWSTQTAVPTPVAQVNAAAALAPPGGVGGM